MPYDPAMGADQSARITATDVSAAVPLAQPVEATTLSPWRRVELRISAVESSRLRRMFSGGGIEIHLLPSPVPGGAFEWSTQVRFPRKLAVLDEFRRAGVEWPVWWAVGTGDMTNLVEKIPLLNFVGFAAPEVALPWFVRLHAAATETDPLAPVLVTRSVESPLRNEDIDDLDDLMRDVNESMMSDRYKAEAYEEWLAREADWKRSTGRT